MSVQVRPGVFASHKLEKIMKYFYYTLWTFKSTPEGMDGPGPYHSTWITNTPPKQFFANVAPDNLREWFFVSFDTEEQMKEFWSKV